MTRVSLPWYGHFDPRNVSPTRRSSEPATTTSATSVLVGSVRNANVTTLTIYTLNIWDGMPLKHMANVAM